MTLDNYSDIGLSGGLNAGFQFEFYCAHCSKKWKSTFKPYRMGQLTGFLSRFSFLLSGVSTAAKTTSGVSDYGSRGARNEALAQAQAQAAQGYVECDQCKSTVCNRCFDASQDTCVRCTELKTEAANGHGASADGQACSNCSTTVSGGRFCAECGFDMASTHKSCPSCGVLTKREVRFCGDCGHGF